MSDDRSPEEIQRLMDQAFFAYVDQLHRDNPEHSYDYCFGLARRDLHGLAHHGDMTDAPPLPGTVPAEEVFGQAGADLEAKLAQQHPEKSQAWHRELAERLLLGEDPD